MLSLAMSVLSFVPTGPKKTCSTEEHDSASDARDSREDVEDEREMVEVLEVGVASGEVMAEKSSG